MWLQGGSNSAPTTVAALPYKWTLPLPRNSSLGTTLNFKVVDMGTGPSTILMLHGFPDSAQVWRNQVMMAHAGSVGMRCRQGTFHLD